MAFTKKTLQDFARYRLRGGADIRSLGIEPYQVIKWEKDAIDRLFYRDMKLDDYVEADLTDAERARAMLYVKPFNDIAVTDGVIDLTTEAEAGLVIQSIPLYGSVNHPDIKDPLIWLATEADLNRPKSRNWGYFTNRGNFLLTRNTDGLLDSMQGLVTIFAGQIPSIAEIPRSRQEKLVNIMVEMFVESLDMQSAQAEAEK